MDIGSGRARERPARPGLQPPGHRSQPTGEALDTAEQQPPARHITEPLRGDTTRENETLRRAVQRCTAMKASD